MEFVAAGDDLCNGFCLREIDSSIEIRAECKFSGSGEAAQAAGFFEDAFDGRRRCEEMEFGEVFTRV